MSDKLPKLPRSSSELINKTINPYMGYKSGPVEDFKREEQISVKDTNIVDFNIGIKDTDEAIKYYIENIIKPYVKQNNNFFEVPVVYENSELWYDIQQKGYYRDKNSKLILPIITFNMNSITPDRTLGNKLDGNKVHLYQKYEKYNNRNRFDIFTNNNRVPSKEIYLSIVPDYVTLQYSFIVQTEFREQLNKIIEAFNYSSHSYWGEKNKFNFRSSIEGSINFKNELNIGENRVCTSNFNVKVNGYLIPDTINKELSRIKAFYTNAKFILDYE